MNLKRGEPGSSEQQELIKVFLRENDDMNFMLAEKNLSIKAKVNVNRSEFREMVSGVTKSLFSRKIVEVEAPSKYTGLKVKEYKGNSDPYEYVCHFEQKMQTVSGLMVKLEVMKCKTFT